MTQGCIAGTTVDVDGEQQHLPKLCDGRSHDRDISPFTHYGTPKSGIKDR